MGHLLASCTSFTHVLRLLIRLMRFDMDFLLAVTVDLLWINSATGTLRNYTVISGWVYIRTNMAVTGAA